MPSRSLSSRAAYDLRLRGAKQRWRLGGVLFVTAVLLVIGLLSWLSVPAFAYDGNGAHRAVATSMYDPTGAVEQPGWVGLSGVSPLLGVPSDASPRASRSYDDRSQLARANASLGEYRLAPNTARALNLPFRDAGLRSQIDDVVRHFDDLGTPPTGIAQGGLKGYPKGTYGGQGLPPKSLGYYTESDVWVSGGGIKRGAERLVFGRGGEVYYTPRHYDDFVRIR